MVQLPFDHLIFDFGALSWETFLKKLSAREFSTNLLKKIDMVLFFFEYLGQVWSLRCLCCVQLTIELVNFLGSGSVDLMC